MDEQIDLLVAIQTEGEAQLAELADQLELLGGALESLGNLGGGAGFGALAESAQAAVESFDALDELLRVTITEVQDLGAASAELSSGDSGILALGDGLRAIVPAGESAIATLSELRSTGQAAGEVIDAEFRVVDEQMQGMASLGGEAVAALSAGFERIATSTRNFTAGVQTMDTALGEIRNQIAQDEEAFGLLQERIASLQEQMAAGGEGQNFLAMAEQERALIELSAELAGRLQQLGEAAGGIEANIAAFRELGASIQQAEQAIAQLSDMGGNAEWIARWTGQIEAAKLAQQQLVAQSAELREALGTVGQEAIALGAQEQAAAEAATTANAELETQGTMARAAAEGKAAAAGAAEGLAGAEEGLGGAAAAANAELAAQAAAAERAAAADAGAANEANGLRLAIGTVGAIAGVSLLEGTVAAAGFQQELMHIRNNTNMDTESMQTMRDTILQLGLSGDNLNNLAEGFMHVQNFTQNATASAAEMQVANEAAVATGDNVAHTGQALAATMREYGLDVSNATDKSAQFNEILANSAHVMGVQHVAASEANATLSDWSDKTARATGLAAALGVPLEQVDAAMSALTKHGFPDLAQAQTQVVNLMSHMVHPTQQAADEIARLSQVSGVDLTRDFSAAGLQAKGLDGVLSDLKTAFSSSSMSMQAQNEVMALLDGSYDTQKQQLIAMGESEAQASEEAMKLINAQRGGLGLSALMTTGYGDFTKILGDLNNQELVNTITEKQYQDTLKTTAQQWHQFTANVHETMIALGDALLPVANAVIGVLRQMAESLRSLTQEHGRLVGAITGAVAAIGLFIGGGAVLGNILPFIGNGLGELNLGVGLIGAGFAAAVPWLAAFAAAAVVLYESYQHNFGGLRDVTRETVGEIISILGQAREALSHVWDVAQTQGFSALIAGLNSLSPALASIGDDINVFVTELRVLWDALPPGVQGFIAITAALVTLGPVAGAVVAIVILMVSHWKEVEPVVAEVAKVLGIVLVGAIVAVIEAIKHFMDGIKSLGEALADLASGDFKGAKQAAEDFLNAWNGAKLNQDIVDQTRTTISAVEQGWDNGANHVAASAQKMDTAVVKSVADQQRFIEANITDLDEMAKQYDYAAIAAGALERTQQGLSNAYNAGLGDISNYSNASNQYNGLIGNINDAVAILQQKQKDGIPLTQQETDLLSHKNEYLARLNGGIKDNTVQSGLLAGAETELIKAQDQVNALQAQNITSGKEWDAAQQELTKHLQEAKSYGMDPMQSAAYDFQQAMSNLGNTIKNDLIPALEDLIDKVLGLPDKKNLTISNNAPEVVAGMRGVQQNADALDNLHPDISASDNFPSVEQHIQNTAAAQDALPKEPVIHVSDNFPDVTGHVQGYTLAWGQAPKDPVITQTNNFPDLTAQIGVARAAEDNLPKSITIEQSNNFLQGAQDMGSLGAAIDQTPKSFTITAYVDTQPAVSALYGLSQMIPHSPAEAGPLAFQPDWGYYFAGLGPAAQEHGLAAVTTLARLLPHSPAEDGPLADIPVWDTYFQGLSQAADKYGKDAVDLTKSYIDTLKSMYDTLNAELDFATKANTFEQAGGGLPAADFVAALTSDTQTATQGFIDLAGTVSSDTDTAVKNYTDAAKGVWDVLTSALNFAEADAASLKTGALLPSDEFLLSLRDKTNDAVQMFEDGAAVFGQASTDAKNYADNAKSVWDVLTAALNFAEADQASLKNGALLPSREFLLQLRDKTNDAVQMFEDAAAVFGSAADAAKQYADDAKSVWDVLEAALKFGEDDNASLSPKVGFILPSKDFMLQLRDATNNAMQMFEDAAAVYGDQADAAKQYAEDSKSIWDLLGAVLKFGEDASSALSGQALATNDQVAALAQQLVDLALAVATMVETAANSTSSALSDSGKQALADWQASFGPISDALKFLTDASTALSGDALASNADAEALGARLTELADNIATSVITAANNSTLTITPAAQDLLSNWKDAFGPLDDALKFLEDVSKFEAGDANGNPYYQNLPASLKQNLIQLVVDVADAIDQAASQIDTTALTAAEAFATKFSPVIKVIQDTITAVEDAVSAYQKAQQASSSSTVGDGAGGTITTTTTVDPVQVFVGMVGQLVQALHAIAQEAAANLGDAASLSSYFTAVNQSLKLDWANFGVNAGGALADGIVAGISDKRQQVIDAVSQLGVDIKTALESALQISSPSRVTRAIGQNTALGLALGLHDGAPLVQAQVANLGHLLAPIASPPHQVRGGGAGPLTLNLTNHTYLGDDLIYEKTTQHVLDRLDEEGAHATMVSR